jgi:hypothetical protein
MTLKIRVCVRFPCPGKQNKKILHFAQNDRAKDKIVGAQFIRPKKAENPKSEYRIQNVGFRVKIFFNPSFVILRAGGESRENLHN